MRWWTGRLFSGPAAIAFERATMLDRKGGRRWTDTQWWPIRRIFGVGGRRVILALIVVDAPHHRHVEPRP